MMKKLWNGSLRGLPIAIYWGLIAVWDRVGTRLFSSLVPHNLAARCSGLRIHPSVTVRFPGSITFADSVSVDRGTEFKSESEDGYLVVGEKTTLGRNVLIDFSGGLEIGNRVMISEGVVTQTHNHGYDPFSVPEFSPMMIEDGVWIATRAIILASVKRIGRNSIIAAGSVVTKDVPENAIVAGSPGRVIAYVEK